MKAWRVWHDPEWCCLVLAKTASKAKALFAARGPTEYNCDFSWVDIRARREPEFDGIADEPTVYDGADGKPEAFWQRFAKDDDFGEV